MRAGLKENQELDESAWRSLDGDLEVIDQRIGKLDVDSRKMSTRIEELKET